MVTVAEIDATGLEESITALLHAYADAETVHIEEKYGQGPKGSFLCNGLPLHVALRDNLARGKRVFHVHGFSHCLRPGDAEGEAGGPKAETRVKPYQVGAGIYFATPEMKELAEQAADTIAAIGRSRVHLHDDGLLNALVTPVDRNALCATFDMAHGLPTWDFVTWLLTAEAERRNSGYRDLRVRLMEGPQGGFRRRRRDRGPDNAECRAILENVGKPLMRLLGVKDWRPSDRDCGYRFPYVTGGLVKMHEAGYELPSLTAPPDVRALVRATYGDRPFVTVTLREARYFPDRNSDLEAWQQFARSCELPVVFVRDTAKANEPMPGFETDARAATDTLYRLALYEQAALNLSVATGPVTLLYHSRAPYLAFNQMKGEGFYPATAHFWETQCFLKEGDQWPWAIPTQRITWKNDTLENIQAEYAAMRALMAMENPQ